MEDGSGIMILLFPDSEIIKFLKYMRTCYLYLIALLFILMNCKKDNIEEEKILLYLSSVQPQCGYVNTTVTISDENILNLHKED